MNHFQTLDHASEQRRAHVAADLARYFSELSGAAPKPEAKFSLRRLVDSMAKREFRVGGSHEAVVVQAAALAAGASFNPNSATVPWSVLAQRDLVTTTATAGGHLVAAQTVTALDVLRPFSVVARLGCRVVEGLAANLLIPSLSAPVTGQWLAGQNVAATASDPTVGLISASPKTATALLRVSHGFMKQGAQADEFIRQQLLSAVGSLLDRAVLQGSGIAGQPTGLASAAGVGTKSGLLTWATVLDALQALGAANCDDTAVRFLATPEVRRMLQARETGIASGRMCWQDDRIAGKLADVSTNVPAATLFAGDFSQILVALWGAGLEIEIDPATNFATGVLQVRCVLHADVVFQKPGAFHRHTEVS